jgi:hypothetical protein
MTPDSTNWCRHRMGMWDRVSRKKSLVISTLLHFLLKDTFDLHVHIDNITIQCRDQIQIWEVCGPASNTPFLSHSRAHCSSWSYQHCLPLDWPWFKNNSNQTLWYTDRIPWARRKQTQLVQWKNWRESLSMLTRTTILSLFQNQGCSDTKIIVSERKVSGLRVGICSRKQAAPMPHLCNQSEWP